MTSAAHHPLHLVQFAGIRRNDEAHASRPGLKLALAAIDGRVPTSVTVIVDPSDPRALAVGRGLARDIDAARKPRRVALVELERDRGSDSAHDLARLRERIDRALLDGTGPVGRLAHRGGADDVAISMESGTPAQWAVTAALVEERGLSARLLALDGDSPLLLDGPSKPSVTDSDRRVGCPEVWAKRYARLPARNIVLLTGRTGVGKTQLARRLHEESSRKAKPFIAVNCAAIPATMLESELFGHAQNAFTGAGKAKPGLFEEAEGGTLFLDEIGELDSGLQAKLLKVLDHPHEGGGWNVRRLGEARVRNVDARIIVATNRDLRAEVVARRFREDLLARIDGYKIDLPPLAERRHRILLAYLEQLAARGKDFGGVSFRLDRTGLKSLRDLAFDKEAPWTWNYRDVTQSVGRLAFEAWEAAGAPADGTITVNPELVRKEAEEMRSRWAQASRESDEATEWNAVRDALPTGRFDVLSELDRLEARFLFQAREAADGNAAQAWDWLMKRQLVPAAGPKANFTTEFRRRWRRVCGDTR